MLLVLAKMQVLLALALAIVNVIYIISERVLTVIKQVLTKETVTATVQSILWGQQCHLEDETDLAAGKTCDERAHYEHL